MRSGPQGDIPGFGQWRHELTVASRGRGMLDITAGLTGWLDSIPAREGLLTLFLRHTSASLTIQENTDPAAHADLLEALDRLAPEGRGYRHRSEGPDDMPAHIKTMLTSVSLSIPVIEGRMALGTWQGVFLIEHRTRGEQRRLMLQYLGLGGPGPDES